MRASAASDPRYRRALRLAAVLNLIMMAVEGGVGLAIGSAALVADAVDFLEDGSVYLLGAAAVGWSARQRAEVGLLMGAAMAGVGLTALGQVVWRLLVGGAPPPEPMAATAAAALAVNVFCAWRLSPFKRGDASMRSIWLSTRNDAILNTATIAAAALVALTATAWPDIAAGLLIAGLNLAAAIDVLRQGWRERRLA